MGHPPHRSCMVDLLTMGMEKPVAGVLPSGMTAVTVTLNTSPWWIGLQKVGDIIEVMMVIRRTWPAAPHLTNRPSPDQPPLTCTAWSAGCRNWLPQPLGQELDAPECLGG